MNPQDLLPDYLSHASPVKLIKEKYESMMGQVITVSTFLIFIFIRKFVGLSIELELLLTVLVLIHHTASHHDTAVFPSLPSTMLTMTLTLPRFFL